MNADVHVRLADTSAGVQAALSEIEGLDVVGVDVERADWDRYFRAAALIQVGGQVGGQAGGPDGAEGHGRVVLVDPLTVEDLTPLADYLRPRVAVLHAMENDLTPLASAGVALDRVEDTAVAAAILGLPTGLGDLLEALLDVTLSGDKQAMQRADWALRPLTDDMRHYAAGDVVHLPELWSRLEQRLEQTGRRPWYEEERNWVHDQPAAEDRRHWTRTRGVGRLDARARARARSLWEIREQLARDTDTAPGRILADRMIVDLAVTPVTAPRELARRGVRRSSVRQFGRDLFDALRDPGQVETAARRRRVSDEDRVRVDRLRALRSARARELGIDAGVLCPNRVLGAAVYSHPDTPDELRDALGLRDWQWQQVGAAFCEALDVDGPGKPASAPSGDDERHDGDRAAPTDSDVREP